MMVDTPGGPARIELDRPTGDPHSLLALGHGAGGGVDAPDLSAVRAAALEAGVMVALITQPYRVAGRRTPPPAPALDAAWIAAVSSIREDLPLVLGGRSSGARVACRTALSLGAVGVVALAFPLHPPGRPDKSRAPELLTGVPTLIVNGDRDPFGVPDQPARSRRGTKNDVTVVVRPGDRHDLRKDLPGTAAIVIEWLAARVWATTAGIPAVTRSARRR